MAGIAGKNATIIQHCAVFGIAKTDVREFQVHNPRPYAQHPTSVSVHFVEPRKRHGALYTMTPGGRRFLTIERDGQLLYDSRTDIPCDMDEWTRRYRESRADALRLHAEFLEQEAKFKAANPDGLTTASDGFSVDKWPER